MDNASPKTISSWLDRYLAGEQPGLAVVMLGILALSAVLGMLVYARLEPGGLKAGGQAFIVELIVALYLISWLFSTLMTHLLAGFFKLRAAFFRALHITGKAWILGLLMLVPIDMITLLFLSLGWNTLAKLWEIAFGGSILWAFLYPAAIKCIYGPQARSCLMTFLAWILFSVGA